MTAVEDVYSTSIPHICLILFFIYIYSSYRLDDQKYENDQLQKNASDIGQVCYKAQSKCFPKFIKFNLQLINFPSWCALMCLWRKIARAIYDIEEATSTAFDIILDHKVYICGLLYFLYELL